MPQFFMTYKCFRRQACCSLICQKARQIWPEQHFTADWNHEVCGTGQDPGTGLKAILQLSVKPAKSPCIKPRSARSEDAVQWTPRSCRVHQASDGMHGIPLTQYTCNAAGAAAKNSLQDGTVFGKCRLRCRQSSVHPAPQAALPRHTAGHLMFAFESHVC